MLLNDLRRIISLVNVPTLILHSKKDPAVPTKHAEKIFNAIQSKDKKIVWIEKGGHVIPEDAGREQAFFSGAAFFYLRGADQIGTGDQRRFLGTDRPGDGSDQTGPLHPARIY